MNLESATFEQLLEHHFPGKPMPEAAPRSTWRRQSAGIAGRVGLTLLGLIVSGSVDSVVNNTVYAAENDEEKDGIITTTYKQDNGSEKMTFWKVNNSYGSLAVRIEDPTDNVQVEAAREEAEIWSQYLMEKGGFMDGVLTQFYEAQKKYHIELLDDDVFDAIKKQEKVIRRFEGLYERKRDAAFKKGDDEEVARWEKELSKLTVLPAEFIKEKFKKPVDMLLVEGWGNYCDLMGINEPHPGLKNRNQFHPYYRQGTVYMVPDEEGVDFDLVNQVYMMQPLVTAFLEEFTEGNFDRLTPNLFCYVFGYFGYKESDQIDFALGSEYQNNEHGVNTSLRDVVVPGQTPATWTVLSFLEYLRQEDEKKYYQLFAGELGNLRGIGSSMSKTEIEKVLGIRKESDWDKYEERFRKWVNNKVAGNDDALERVNEVYEPLWPLIGKIGSRTGKWVD